MLVFYYCIGKKKQHILASLRKAEQNIFVPSGLATGVFEELPKIIKIYQTEGFDSAVAGKKRGLNEAAASEKRRLSREEEKKVANWIVDKNPAQLKFDFALCENS